MSHEIMIASLHDVGVFFSDFVLVPFRQLVTFWTPHFERLPLASQLHFLRMEAFKARSDNNVKDSFSCNHLIYKLFQKPIM